MTVQTNTTVATGIGNGVTSVFPIPFKFNRAEDLIVYLVIQETEEEIPLTLHSDYTVTGAGNENGGNLTMLAGPLPIGQSVVAQRIVDLRQLTDLRNQGRFFAEVHEDVFDKLVMIDQQQQTHIDRAMVVDLLWRWNALNRRIINVGDPIADKDAAHKRYVDQGDNDSRSYADSRDAHWVARTLRTADPLSPLPGPETRAGKLLSFDSTGRPVVVAPEPQSATELAVRLADPADGAGLVRWIRGAAGAVARWLKDKLEERVSLLDFMTEVEIEDYRNVGNGVLDHTAPMLAAIDYLRSRGGGVLKLPPGLLRATRLPIVSGVVWEGEYGCTFVQCIDNSSLDAGVPFGSFIRKADDGARVTRAGFRNIYIGSAISSVAASEDEFASVIGLNLCACERTELYNVTLAGFGYAGLVLARAEGGIEGLGFVNTVQDGNHTTGNAVTFVSCGKHGPERAALWLKFKANSNKFQAVYAKPARRVAVITHGNDNLISGMTAETSESIVYFGAMAWGNTIIGARAENLSSHAYDFHEDARNNTIIGGYYTGVDGNLLNNIENTDNNTAIIPSRTWLSVTDFPPGSSISTEHSRGCVKVTSLEGGNDQPLIVKHRNYNQINTYPAIQLWDSKVNGTAGAIIGALDFSNLDSSGGAAGVSVSVRAVFEGSTGQSALVFETGTGGARVERMRIKSNGRINITSVPTSATGLSSGDIWSDDGTLKIVP